jgi:hypothetical protein
VFGIGVSNGSEFRIQAAASRDAGKDMDSRIAIELCHGCELKEGENAQPADEREHDAECDEELCFDTDECHCAILSSFGAESRFIHVGAARPAVRRRFEIPHILSLVIGLQAFLYRFDAAFKVAASGEQAID